MWSAIPAVMMFAVWLISVTQLIRGALGYAAISPLVYGWLAAACAATTAGLLVELIKREKEIRRRQRVKDDFRSARQL